MIRSLMVLACSLLVTTAALGQIDRLSKLEQRPTGIDRITWHTEDPQVAITFIEAQLPIITREADRTFANRLLERLHSIERPTKIRLSLNDAVRRLLVNSHTVRVQSYNPAINTASIVEAEGAFDAVYFMNLSKNVRDVPTASQLAGSKIDTFSLTGGLRKLLPNGMQVSASLNLSRTATDNQFQTLNPAYNSALVGDLTQPLLRNGGIDFNRSNITIARNDRKISQQAFKRQVRQSLFLTEQLYWQLVRARREVTIRARLLSEFEKIYDFLWQRRDFDTYQIQLSQTKANLESSKADFIRVVNELHNAEDRLVATMNDPELNLATHIEIIPEDFPTSAPLKLDSLAEVQAALDSRSEIAEARLQIDNAGVRVGVAKNLALPRLDLNFRYTVNGLGSNGDQAFDQVTQSNFIDYLVGLNFEVPIGNRAAEAAERRARLIHAQQIAALKAQTEQVILDVNLAVRNIHTTYQLIDPSLESAQANEDQVTSVIARAERKDFTALNQELGARNALATSRSALLDALVQYNIAIIELERSKGTLLDYNNISLQDDEDN